MLENYSRRGITKLSDRAVAISGLLDRIETILPCRIHHGIIEWYLHRTLLWRRVTGKAVKIPYESREVPSWSWMAYSGPVVFLNDAFGTYDAFQTVHFSKRTVQTTIWKITNPGIRCRPVADPNMGYQFQLRDSNELDIGFITFDEESKTAPELNVAIIARRLTGTGLQYFVLFIGTAQEGYQRLGMGVLNQDCELEMTLREGVIF